jgi:hypothetical protein
MPMTRRSSSSRSPVASHTALPRREPPPNPPEPPMTLLHPTTSPLRETRFVEGDQHTAEQGRGGSDKTDRGANRWISWFGRGMYHDVRRRLPWYVSDWTDAWNYRVIPSTWVGTLSRARGRRLLMTHSSSSLQMSCQESVST